MTGCTATLTTATVKPCQHWRNDGMHRDYHGHARGCGYFEGEWVRVLLHTLTCEHDAYHDDWHSHRPYSGGGAHWSDDTPGARPHTPPAVTDAELSAARDAYEEWLDSDEAGDGLRVALEAAARVRQQAGEA